MLKRLIGLVALCFVSSVIRSNSIENDSLLLVIEQLPTYGEKDSTLAVYASKVRRTNKELSIAYSEKRIALAKEADNEKKLALSIEQLGRSYSEYKEKDKSIALVTEAYEMFLEQGDLKGQMRTLQINAVTYRLFGEYQKALTNSKKSLAILEEIDKPQVPIVLDNIAIIYYQLDDYENAIHHNKRSLKLRLALEQFEQTSINYENFGLIYSRQGKFNDALSYYLKALSINREFGKESSEARNHFHIASLYQQIGKDSLALSSLQEAEKYFLDKGLKYELASTYNNLGNIYKNLDHLEKALTYYKKSIDLKDSIGLRKILGNPLNNIGTIYKDQRKSEIAIGYFLKAVKIEQETGHKLGESRALFNLAECYLQLNEFTRAEIYGDKSLSIALEIESLERVVAAYKVLSKINEQSGNYREALEFKDYYIKYNDSLISNESVRVREELIQKYLVQLEEIGLREKEKEVEILKKNEEVQSLRILILAISTIVILAVFLAVYLWQKKKSLSRINRLMTEIIMLEERSSSFASDASQKLAQNQELKSALELKDKELADFTLHLIKKNKFLENLKSEVRNRKDYADLIRAINQNLNGGGDWDKFQEYFNQVHDDFFRRFSKEFNDLTPSEVRLVSLLRLNKSSKEIANILGISAQSVNIARHRLRKKLQLSSDVNLGGFIHNY